MSQVAATVANNSSNSGFEVPELESCETDAGTEEPKKAECTCCPKVYNLTFNFS
jgi:hypothetical protein